MSPTRSSLTPGCDILQRQLRGPCKRRVVRLAPGEKSSESRKKVGHGAGLAPWGLEVEMEPDQDALRSTV